MKRGLPILWVAYNDKLADDALQLLLNSALSVAKRYRGQLTFVQLDVDAQPQIAQNFGFDVADSKGDGDPDEEDEDEDDDEEGNDDSNVLPQVFIMNQIAQIKERVDMDDIEGTVTKVINDYLQQLRISRGQGMPDMMDDAEMEYDDDDDDEFEEDDEDEEEEEEVDTVYDADAGKAEGEGEGDDDDDDDDGESAGDRTKTDL